MIRYNKYMTRTVACLLCVILFSGCSNKDSNVIYPETTDIETTTTLEDISDIEDTTDKILEVYVQICGEVSTPGVYKVSSNLRVFQVIDLAGGFTDKADINVVNMARPVSDEMKIYIPALGEVAQEELYHGVENYTTSLNQENKKVNINTASKEELMTLNGIGEAKADAIIQYRDEVGRFGDISQIMNISGIKEAAFNKIKGYITIR